MKVPSLILDSLRIDINDLKDDARDLMPRTESGYFADDSSVFWNLCLVAVKRFMSVVTEFDKLSFSQQELDELTENFFNKMVEELTSFEEEFDEAYVDPREVSCVLLECFNEVAKRGWKVDFSNEKVLYRKKR